MLLVRERPATFVVMLRCFLRHYSVGPSLDLPQVESLLASTKWSIESVIKNKNVDNIQIDRKVLEKLLRLLGLEDNMSQDREEELLRSLKVQMAFTDHLYDGVKDDTASDANLAHTYRLLYSDHNPVRPQSLRDLKAQISKLRSDPEKGECGNWGVFETSNRLKPASGYFEIVTKRT